MTYKYKRNNFRLSTNKAGTNDFTILEEFQVKEEFTKTEVHFFLLMLLVTVQLDEKH